MSTGPGRSRLRNLAVVVALFAAVVASTVPTTAAVAARNEAPAQPVSWLAAGDSYSSGHGTPGAEGTCAQNDQAWPGVAKSRTQLAVSSDDYRFAACTGDVSQELFGQAKGGKYDLVTFSFGGDDVAFPTVLAACLTGVVEVGNPWLKPILGCPPDIVAGLLIKQEITDRYRDFLTRAANEVTNRGGNIVVVGYPELVEEPQRWSGVAQTLDLCHGLRRDAASHIRGWAGKLNAEIGKAVADVNAQHPNDVRLTFVNIHDGAGADPSDPDLYEPKGSAQRHNLCGTDEWLNGTHYPKGYHPKIEGYKHTAEVVAKVLDGLDWSALNSAAVPAGPQDCGPDPSSPEWNIVARNMTCDAALRIRALYSAAPDKQGSSGHATIEGWACASDTQPEFAFGAYGACTKGDAGLYLYRLQDRRRIAPRPRWPEPLQASAPTAPDAGAKPLSLTTTRTS